MVVSVPEAHSANKVITLDDCLRLIPGQELTPIFRRHHLNDRYPVIIGLIGDRGAGKSGSAASIALIDCLLRDRPVWSNMKINCDLEVSDEQANRYGLNKGGVVKFQSQELDKRKLLTLDSDYQGGCILTDEVNMEFAEARRSMSNTNLLVDTVAQQIRKFRNWWIYTVINEMFVDNRLRDLTDIFIKSSDTAMTSEGLCNCKQPGVDFKWTVYPMTGYLCGEERKYSITKKPLAPVYFHFQCLRGIYDDRQAQAIGKLKYGFDTKKWANEDMQIGNLETQQSPEIQQRIKDYSWLETIANEMYADGRKYIPIEEIYQRQEVQVRQLTKQQVSSLLKAHFNLHTRSTRLSGHSTTVYEIPEDILVG